MRVHYPKLHNIFHTIYLLMFLLLPMDQTFIFYLHLIDSIQLLFRQYYSFGRSFDTYEAKPENLLMTHYSLMCQIGHHFWHLGHLFMLLTVAAQV